MMEVNNVQIKKTNNQSSLNKKGINLLIPFLLFICTFAHLLNLHIIVYNVFYS